MQTEETLLEFPTRFPIKAMGKHSDDFEQHVQQLVSAHVRREHLIESHQHTSRNANYLAVTITIQAQSKKQLDAIYHTLTADSRVLMAL